MDKTAPLDALKVIPQAFFDLFARLVPGLVAFALWFSVFCSETTWSGLLTRKLGPVKGGPSTSLVVIGALAASYVIGQLTAPFGKAIQRVCENIAEVAGRHMAFGLVLLWIRKIPAGVTAREHQKLEKKTNKAKKKAERKSKKQPKAETSASNAPKAEKSAQKKTGDYDWLRANRSELGALVAKIRGEHTMFYSLSAVFLAGAGGTLARNPTGPDPAQLATFFGLAVACAIRGYTVSVTLKDTSKKLRNAAEEADTARAQSGQGRGHPQVGMRAQGMAKKSRATPAIR